MTEAAAGDRARSIVSLHAAGSEPGLDSAGAAAAGLKQHAPLQPDDSLDTALQQQRADSVCTALKAFLQKADMAEQISISVQGGASLAEEGQMSEPAVLQGAAQSTCVSPGSTGCAHVLLSNGHNSDAAHAEPPNTTVTRQLPGGGSIMLQLSSK